MPAHARTAIGRESRDPCWNSWRRIQGSAKKVFAHGGLSTDEYETLWAWHLLLRAGYVAGNHLGGFSVGDLRLTELGHEAVDPRP
jgi:hypothetical protein